MTFDLLSYICWQTLLGQLGEKWCIEHQGHDGPVGTHNERENEVKFLRRHSYVSEDILMLLQDETPILPIYFSARDLMPVSFVRI